MCVAVNQSAQPLVIPLEIRRGDLQRWEVVSALICGKNTTERTKGGQVVHVSHHSPNCEFPIGKVVNDPNYERGSHDRKFHLVPGSMLLKDEWQTSEYGKHRLLLGNSIQLSRYAHNSTEFCWGDGTVVPVSCLHCAGYDKPELLNDRDFWRWMKLAAPVSGMEDLAGLDSRKLVPPDSPLLNPENQDNLLLIVRGIPNKWRSEFDTKSAEAVREKVLS